jgi:transposase
MSESQKNDSIPPRELTESQEENLLPEHRKTLPRIIVTKEELDEIQKKRKLKISDLIKFSSGPPSAGNLSQFA